MWCHWFCCLHFICTNKIEFPNCLKSDTRPLLARWGIYFFYFFELLTLFLFLLRCCFYFVTVLIVLVGCKWMQNVFICLKIPVLCFIIINLLKAKTTKLFVDHDKQSICSRIHHMVAHLPECMLMNSSAKWPQKCTGFECSQTVGEISKISLSLHFYKVLLLHVVVGSGNFLLSSLKFKPEHPSRGNSLFGSGIVLLLLFCCIYFTFGQAVVFSVYNRMSQNNVYMQEIPGRSLFCLLE